MAAYDLEGMLAAPDSLVNETNNCWVDRQRWQEHYDMQGHINITLNDTTNCDLQKVSMYYKDYYEYTEFTSIDDLTYTVTPSSYFP